METVSFTFILLVIYMCVFTHVYGVQNSSELLFHFLSLVCHWTLSSNLAVVRTSLKDLPVSIHSFHPNSAGVTGSWCHTLLVCLSWDKVSPCSPGWPGSHYVEQAGLKLICHCLLWAGIKGVHLQLFLCRCWLLCRSWGFELFINWAIFPATQTTWLRAFSMSIISMDVWN